jgi:tetratricopeptide (TPR) repeat protein
MRNRSHEPGRVGRGRVCAGNGRHGTSALWNLVHWQKICAALIVCAASRMAPGQSPGSPNSFDRAVANHDFGRALQLVDSALVQHPADCQLLTLRGRVLSSMNRKAEALDTYRRAMRSAPSCISALEGAAKIEYDSGDARARETLGRIIALQPSNQPAHAMLGELAYQNNDCKGTVGHFERAPEPISRRPEALQQYGACLFKLNQPEKAAAMFGRVVSLDPTNTDAAFDLGLSLLAAKRPAEAVGVLRRLADTPAPESDVLNLLGEAYASASQTDEAIKVLRRAVELYPEDSQNYEFLSSLCVKHHAYDIAAEVLDAGIAKLPESATLRTMRGVVFMCLGQKKDAEESFNEAMKLAPQESYGGLGMGIALSFSGEDKASADVLRAQLIRTPDDPAANYFLAWVLLHQTCEPGMPEFDEVRAALGRALAAKPDFVQARVLRARTSLQLHHDADAIADLERAVELDPTAENAVYLLLQAYARAGRRADAAKLAGKLHDLLAAKLTRESHTALLVKTPGDDTAPK